MRFATIGAWLLAAACAASGSGATDRDDVRAHPDRPFRGGTTDLIAVSIPNGGSLAEVELGRTIRLDGGEPCVPLIPLGHDATRDAHLFAAATHGELREVLRRLRVLGLPVPADDASVTFLEDDDFHAVAVSFGQSWGCGTYPQRASTIATWPGGGLLIPVAKQHSWSRTYFVGSFVFGASTGETAGEFGAASTRAVPVTTCDLAPRARIVWTDGTIGVYRDVDGSDAAETVRIEVRPTIGGVAMEPRHLYWSRSSLRRLRELDLHLWRMFDALLAMHASRPITFRLVATNGVVEFTSPGEGNLSARDTWCANRLVEALGEFADETAFVLEVEQ